MKKNRVKTFLLLSICLVVLSTGITYFNDKSDKSSLHWVDHTHAVIRQSLELQALLKDAETGVRGYLITGDKSFLMPYEKAVALLPVKVDSISRLVRDNKQQTMLFNENIKPLIILRKAQLKKTLNIYNKRGAEKAYAHVKTGIGNRTMDKLRTYIQLFTQQEDELLKTRLKDLEHILLINNAIRYSSFLLIGITCVLALGALNAKQKQNDDLVTELNLVNHSLDKKVKDRTRELEQQNATVLELNERLNQSIEEIQSFYEALQLRNIKAEDTITEVRDLYNNAPCGYHSLSADGIIIRINDTELAWLGYRREEVVNKLTLSDIVTEGSKNVFKENYDRFKKQGYIHDLEFVFVRKNGTTFPILLNSTAVKDENGNFAMSRSTVFDLSQRKQIENNLIIANEKLVALNEEKNHILGIAAHDLKSPIHGILGLLNLVKLEEPSLSPEQREYLHYIEQSCISMQRLITNLLDINRIEHGTDVINAEMIQLNEHLHRNFYVFKEHADRKNITLILEDLAPDTSLTTDPLALSRVLENLISNAIKFSNHNKEIILRAIHHKNYIKLEVVDQGPGIKPDELHLLFGKFQKLSARPTDGESSTGLGLAITKELVEALGGKISVESEVNIGTKFIIELPLNQDAVLS